MQNRSKRQIIAHRQQEVAKRRLRGWAIDKIVQDLEDSGIVDKNGKAWTRSTIDRDIKALEKTYVANAQSDAAIWSEQLINELVYLREKAIIAVEEGLMDRDGNRIGENTKAIECLMKVNESMRKFLGADNKTVTNTDVDDMKNKIRLILGE